MKKENKKTLSVKKIEINSGLINILPGSTTFSGRVEFVNSQPVEKIKNR